MPARAGSRPTAQRVQASWSGVAVVRSEVGEVGAAGADVAVRALVRLGGLEPAELSVEAVVDADAPFSVVLEPGAEEDGGRWFEGSVRAAAGQRRRSGSACFPVTPTSRTRGR